MQGSGQGPVTTIIQVPGEPLPPVPRGGGRFIISEDGQQKVVTYTSLPPELGRLARGAKDTAFGLMGILAAIIILGPFARMLARRMERRAEAAPSPEVSALRHQIEQLQQSVDAMSVEVERISESQRFQSRLLFERSGPERVSDHIS